ncbi:MAG: WbqC family protein [Ferruginibacter sp.]
MTIAVMQPYFFPYIGYFQMINAVDRFVIFDDVNYINKGWINRNNILVNGKPNKITVPLKEASQNKLIRDIFLSDDQKGIDKIGKTIEMSYKKAPFFGNVFSFIHDCISAKTGSISEYNTKILRATCSYLDIRTAFVSTSSVYNNTSLQAQERILDICAKENADEYINAIGGMELYSKELFRERNVRLKFIKAKPVVYKQSGNEFVPWLSMIDILMFNSPEQINEMLNQYELF